MNRKRLSYLIAAVAVIAILVLGWVGLVSPQLQQAAAARDQITAVQAQNQILTQTLATLKTDSGKLPDLTAQLSALRAQIPNAESIGSFVDEVQSLAETHGVSLTKFTVPEATAYPTASVVAPVPAPAASGAATASPTPAVTSAPAAGTLTAPSAGVGSSTDLQPSAALRPNLYIINLSFAVAGSRQNMISFLGAVQTGNRLFLATTVSAAAQDAKAEGTATVGGYVFVIATPAEIAARTLAATTATPAPSGTASPAPSPSATATPTPSSTPTKKP